MNLYLHALWHLLIQRGEVQQQLHPTPVFTPAWNEKVSLSQSHPWTSGPA